MFITKYLLLPLCLALVLLSNSALAYAPVQSKDLSHTAVFGILTINDEGAEAFTATNSVPLVEGQTYGWIIRLDSLFTKVTWKEVLELPAEPETWDFAEADSEHVISGDRKTSITENEVFVEDGYIQSFWTVVAGDPVGKHIIRVYVNGILLETFHFEVIAK
jgi:hypothetical protein